MTQVDPILLSIIRFALESIAEDMGITMRMTSRSPIFSEAGDFSCAVFDSKARLIAQQEAIPIHLGAASFATRAVVDFFDDQIHEGDVFLVNDPYGGGNHIPDWTILLPVFFENELLGWTATRAHQVDTGGMILGGYFAEATDIFQEGLIIPPLKIYENNVARKDVLNLLMKNVRIPEVQRGDLNAMIGAARVGGRRITELARRYGKRCFEEVVDYLPKATEDMMRAEIKKMPDGVYSGEDWVDDSREGGVPVRIKVAMAIKHDQISFDFSESSRQVETFINSSLANLHSAVFTALMSVVDPDIPHNEGCYKPVSIVAPEGTVVNSRWPAPVTLCTLVVAAQIIEACWDALSKAVPEKVPSGWGKSAIPVAAGVNPETGRQYAWTHFSLWSGGSAVRGRDGEPNIGFNISLGGHWGPNIEMIEANYPVLVLEHEFLCDSAGSGKWRGGLGVSYKFKNYPEHQATLSYVGDGLKTPASGRLGGRPGRTNVNWLTKPDGTQQRLHSKKTYNMEEADVVCGESQGGGGLGDPKEREVESVRRDVMDRVVSIVAASEEYGVAIKADTYEIDHGKTTELRNSTLNPGETR